MSDILVFFSTHYVNREDEKEGFLFRPEWIEAITSTSLTHTVFCLKDTPAIFARKALSTADAKSSLVANDLIDEVNAAWQSLEVAAQKKIRHIYLFIHANELENTHSVRLLPPTDVFYNSLKIKLNLPEEFEIKVFNFRHRKGLFSDDILRYDQPAKVADFIKNETRRYLQLAVELKVQERKDVFEKLQQRLLNLPNGISKSQLLHIDQTDKDNFSLPVVDDTRLIIAYLPSRYLDQLENFLSTLEKTLDVKNKLVPILFYGKHDLFGETISIKAYLDPRYRYLDASIWFRYLPSKTVENEEESELIQVVMQIANSLDQGVHHSVVAQEYREFNWRLFQNAYLEKIGNFGGHASAITPFAFHSETAMGMNAEQREQAIKSYSIQWDALLVDDYANAPLRAADEAFENQTPQKEVLIRSLLGDTIEQLKSAATLADAKEAIGKVGKDKDAQVYDFILLDYLFSRGQEGQPVYGTRLLEEISEGKVNHGKAANFKYWVFPVSVFSEALASDLQEKSIQYQETHWVLARGADPVNTPQLFRAALLEFMQLQYDGLAPDFGNLVQLWLQHPIEESQRKAVDPRRWARRFNTVLAHHFGKSDTLSYNSTFTRSAKKAFKLNVTETDELSRPRQVLELLKRLIYNLGFSSIFDHEVNAAIYKQMYGYCKEELAASTLTDIEKDSFRNEVRKLGEGIYAIHNTYD